MMRAAVIVLAILTVLGVVSRAQPTVSTVAHVETEGERNLRYCKAMPHFCAVVGENLK